MKIDEHLLRLERKLGRNLERLTRRKGTRPEAVELIPAILEEIEERIEPTGGTGRTFPYDRIAVQVAVEPARAAAFRAVFAHDPPLEERIRERLRQAGCEPPPTLKVALKLVEGARPRSWGKRDFHIDYEQRARPVPASDKRAPTADTPALRLVVLEGKSGRRTYELHLAHIDIGRMDTVVDRSRRKVRRNHLAFLDREDEVNATVSRAHAHIEYDPAERAFRLFDDDSAQGTRLVREGRPRDVPPRGSRGVKLRHGDELEFGRARALFQTEW